MIKGHERDVSNTQRTHPSDSIKDSKDIVQTISILDSSTIKTNPFGANVSIENSYKRAERIVAALHILTNHVREDEPIRESIRKNGLELLDTLLELRTGIRALVSDRGQETLATIRRLISFIRMLAIAGYISTQNAATVADALDDLGNLIVSSQRSTLADQFSLTRADLMPPPSVLTPVSRQDKGSATHVPAKDSVSGESLAEAPKNSIPDDGRGARIVEILRAGGVLGIKDIAANLPQYSEKMIQRELADLVQGGNVRKIGEKRWSRYQVI